VLAGTGVVIGTGCLLSSGPVGRLAGLPAHPGARWLLRLFGVRELVLGVGLARALQANDPGRALVVADLIALAQVGDLGVTGAMALAGRVQPRRLAGVVLGAVPTLAAIALARRTLSPGGRY
jgi:hypothetical protein